MQDEPKAPEDVLTRERDEARALRTQDALVRQQQITEGQKAAAARFGFEPGKLQWAWRQGQRSDVAELEWAIVDALAMGGVLAWPGDGVGCAAQIASFQLNRALAAEAALAASQAEVERLREGLRPFAVLADDYLADTVNFDDDTILAGRIARRNKEGTPPRVTFADFRRARALTADQEQPK